MYLKRCDGDACVCVCGAVGVGDWAVGGRGGGWGGGQVMRAGVACTGVAGGHRSVAVVARSSRSGWVGEANCQGGGVWREVRDKDDIDALLQKFAIEVQKRGCWEREPTCVGRPVPSREG